MNTIKGLINLKGRRALITGACGGLGIVIAETLSELGADLLLLDRNESNLNSHGLVLAKNWNINVELFACDLENELQRKKLIKEIKDSHKGLNIIINNAAFTGESDLKGWSVPFEDQCLQTWRRALEVNLTAIFDICQGLTPILKEGVGASIVNIGSIYGMVGPDWGLYGDTKMSNPAAYGATKGGVIQLTRWLATTMAPNIRVNAVSPGGIFRGQPNSFVKKYEARTPLGRMASENDFRGIVAFLASDLSKYVTGQNIAVDGGWTVW
jgi:NAD(P)-dependent dehydrogenase (short-subunit alcohol dehydrogenase family)